MPRPNRSRSRRALASADDFVTQARSRTVRAAILARRGDRAQAELLAREALDIAAPTDSFGEHAQALVSLANLLVMDGRESEAAVFLAEAAELYERKAA